MIELERRATVRLRSLAAITFATSLSLAALTAGAIAQDGDALAEEAGVTASPESATESAAAGEDWTPETFAEAQPPELPTPSDVDRGMPEGFVMFEAELRASPTESEDEPGAPPQVETMGTLEEPITYQPEVEPRGDTDAEAVSSFGGHFTTTRVLPDAALEAYPFRAAGKLFFRDPRTGRRSVCSAAVLRLRIVATAGHCVTRPSPNAGDRYFFTDFVFVPAYNNGIAPFGVWRSSRQWVSNDWHFSNGSVPNRGDLAMLVVDDQDVNDQDRRIGEVTGWLGYRTDALANNHVTMLGYPCNIDSCRRMQMTNAGTFADGGQNTFIYGSAGRGGHSGGAWIQDFGQAGAGSPTGLLGLNRLVGITSYGPVSTGPKYLGASNFGANFTSLLTAACNQTTGNC